MIDKNPKMHDSSGVTNQGLTFLEFLIRSRKKSTLRGCFASLGNDEILELFALMLRLLRLCSAKGIKASIKNEF